MGSDVLRNSKEGLEKKTEKNTEHHEFYFFVTAPVTVDRRP